MYNVSPQFHNAAVSGNVKSRLRMYFIDDFVNCTDDNDVTTNGKLLTSPGDPFDSNGRISESSGITLNEMFMRGEELEIGDSVSSTLNVTFLNNDGALNTFEFGRCKVYLDVQSSGLWIPCPLGVFLFERPVKRRIQLIQATAYDQMQLLDKIADNWWNGLDFSNGVTLSDLLLGMAAQVGVIVNPSTISGMTNGSYSYTASPFTSVEMTYRDILNWIAGAACSIARFDRDGFLCLKFFKNAEIDNNSVTIDADTINTTCFRFDLAEYEVPTIDKLQVTGAETDIGVIVGAGLNAYRIVDNGLLYGLTEADILERATPIYNVLNAFGAYTPLLVELKADWSIEAGDVIYFVRGNQSYRLPIFQQSLSWRGGYVHGEIISDGYPERLEISAQNRSVYRSKKQMHEFDVTVEQLLSRITDLDGNFSVIQQTISNITQIISNQNDTLLNILDKDGEIWTAIKTNSSDVSNLEDQINADLAERQSYVRILPAEPAIVLGFADGTVVKLKQVNNAVYFYKGEDSNTDISKAFAYFTSEEFYDQRIVAGRSLQIGSSDAAVHWQWQKLDNGDLVLDMF